MFAENYTYRVKRHGKTVYFNIGKDLKAANALADDIAIFLAQKTNTIEDAIARFSPEKLAPQTRGEKCVPKVGEFIARYETITQHLRPATVRNNSGALRRIAAFILGFKHSENRALKQNGINGATRLMACLLIA